MHIYIPHFTCILPYFLLRYHKLHFLKLLYLTLKEVISVKFETILLVSIIEASLTIAKNLPLSKSVNNNYTVFN